MLGNEHDTTSQPVQPIARQWVPLVTSLSAHDLDHGVVVVSSRWMYWYASGFVDDDHIVVFVHGADRLSSDWRLMSMQRMADDVAIFDNRTDRRHLFAVQMYRAGFYGSFLYSQSDSGILNNLIAYVRSILPAYL